MTTKGKKITLAIHTYRKAVILKNELEKAGIEVFLDDVNDDLRISTGIRVRIKDTDLPKALGIVDEFSIAPTNSLVKACARNSLVLIPIDFSEYAIKACDVGFHYAGKHDLGIVLLHSYISQSYSGSMAFGEFRKEHKLADRVKRKGTEAKLQMIQFETLLKDQIKSGQLPAVEFHSEIVEGIPEDAILDYAKSVSPELIVMGTRGKHKKEEDLIGSVTAEVLDSIQYPMFVVPEGISLTDFEKMRNIMFYSNLEQLDLLSLDIFMQKFRCKSKNISVVHVANKREKFIEKRLDAVVEYCRKQYQDTAFSQVLFNEDTFLADFDKYLKEQSIDMAVIPNKKRNIFSRLFNPSVAHRILFHTDIPMLVIPVVK